MTIPDSDAAILTETFSDALEDSLHAQLAPPTLEEFAHILGVPADFLGGTMSSMDAAMEAFTESLKRNQLAFTRVAYLRVLHRILRETPISQVWNENLSEEQHDARAVLPSWLLEACPIFLGGSGSPMYAPQPVLRDLLLTQPQHTYAFLEQLRVLWAQREFMAWGRLHQHRPMPPVLFRALDVDEKPPRHMLLTGFRAHKLRRVMAKIDRYQALEAEDDPITHSLHTWQGRYRRRLDQRLYWGTEVSLGDQFLQHEGALQRSGAQLRNTRRRVRRVHGDVRIPHAPPEAAEPVPHAARPREVPRVRSPRDRHLRRGHAQR